MIKVEEVMAFYNGFVYAGVKNNLYSDKARQGQIVDFYKRYANVISSEELSQIGEILKSNGEWPTYQLVDSLLLELRGNKENKKTEAKDAYPDGDEWQNVALAFGYERYKSLSQDILEQNLRPLYWLKQAERKCESCKGKECRYYGHRPYLRCSENGTQFYKCVSKKVCKYYSSSNANLGELNANTL